VVANEGAEHFDDLGFVSRRVVHKPFKSVDTANADIEFCGAKEAHVVAEPFSDLALLGEAQRRAVGVISDEHARRNG
jgi:hypothetical protein